MHFFIALTEINWDFFSYQTARSTINSVPFFQFKFTYYKSKSNSRLIISLRVELCPFCAKPRHSRGRQLGEAEKDLLL
jgi:hypothetical protein